MAIIPNDEKFIGLSASVDTTERRSALINAESQAYTMQDITDTVSAGVVNTTSQYVPIKYNGEFADGPINALIAPNGYLGWSTVATQVGALTSPPVGVDQTNIAPYLPLYGLSITNNPIQGSLTTIGDTGSGTLRLNVINNYPPNPAISNSLYAQNSGGGYNSPFWVKGDGSLVQIGEQPSFNNTNILNGIISNRTSGFFKINCGITSPNDGVISANGSTGLIIMGTNGAGYSLGVNFYNNTIHAGSGLTSPYPPIDPGTPIAWLKVSDEYGNNYNLPLYQ